MKKTTLVIYHGNCADGFAAAYAVWFSQLGARCDFVEGHYGKPPPNIAAGQYERLVLVDFSYSAVVLMELRNLVGAITVLDHHKTAEADLRDLMGEPGFEILFDMERSGARMAWDYFNGHHVEVPTLIAVIEDRDLWRFALPHTRELAQFIFSFDYTFENYGRLHVQLSTPQGLASAVFAGEALRRNHDKDVRDLVASTRMTLHINDFEVPACNLPFIYASDAGHMLCQQNKDAPFAACFTIHGDTVKFSLRSDTGRADVSAVAKLFGGGGHHNAAGFSVPTHRLFNHPDGTLKLLRRVEDLML